MPADNENIPEQQGSGNTPGAYRRSTDGIGTIGHGDYVSDDRRFGYYDGSLHIPTGNSEVMLTRRQLLYGALGVAAVAAVGGVASAVSEANQNSNQVESLEVAEGEVFTLDDCTETPVEDALEQIGEYSLPYGSLVWAGNDTMAACLLPTNSSNPLVQGALLNLTSGYSATVLEQADSQGEGFEIYDIRASEEGAIWAEGNILSGRWRIYTASIYDMTLEEHHLVDEGDASREMPTLAAIGDTAFWQVMPALPTEEAEEADETQDGEDEAAETQVKACTFANPGAVEVIFSCEGRCSTAISPANDEKGVVITPLQAETTSHRQLTVIDAQGQVLDTMTLPTRMVPMEACYGGSGFAFSFENIYNYGEGIANLGTYTPQEKPGDSAYSHRPWFRFARTPTIPPSWCGDWFMVKSTSAVVAIHLKDRRYAILPTDNNAENYGDCLASMGSNSTVVTYTNIDRTAAIQDSEQATDSDRQCLVRIWTTPQ